MPVAAQRPRACAEGEQVEDFDLTARAADGALAGVRNVKHEPGTLIK